MKLATYLLLSTNRLNFPLIRKYILMLIIFREWDRFAKAEYERLAMEEENGEDSEMLDAMEGWDSDQDDQQNRDPNNANNTGEGGAAGGNRANNTAGANAAARQATGAVNAD